MTEIDLHYASATELAALIRSKALSPLELMQATLARAEALQGQLNAFSRLLPEAALQAARTAEDSVMRGDPLGPLHGLPLSVKDMVNTGGIPTTMGSRIFEQQIPDRDAPVIERLRGAGAILFGKTNTPEFGWKAVTDSPLTGITRNPWNTAMTPGGSSGGAAAAIAAGIGPLTTGGDGAGSIRIPASFSGVFGIKPHFGRIPAVPQAGGMMLAHLGPLARTVADAALFLDVTAGPDDRDRLSIGQPAPGYSTGLDSGVHGLRIACSTDLGYVDLLDAEVYAATMAAAKLFEQLGAEVDVIDDPGFGNPKPIIETFWRINFANTIEAHREQWSGQLDPGLEACAAEGRELGPLAYAAAQAEREAYWRRVQPFFNRYDLLLTPAVATLPFEAGTLYPSTYSAHPWDWIRWAPFSFPFNLTQQPAASVPAGYSSSGLPIGVQIVGRRFDESRVLQAAAAFEHAQPWRGRRPPI